MTPKQSPRVVTRRLRNGLPVVAVELPHLAAGYVSLHVRTGPRHETGATHGLSHVAEHMLFRGAGRWPNSHAVAAAAEAFMGTPEAATYRDHASYGTTFRPDGLKDALALLAAMVRAPRLEGLEVERNVILEEIQDAFDERGRVIDVDNVARQLLFGAHPAGRSIDGTPQGIARLSRAALRAHHRRFYVAKNMALCVAGPNAVAKVQAAASRAFGSLRAGARASLPQGSAVPVVGPQVHWVPHPGSQVSLRLCFAACPVAHPHAVALQVLRRVLDDGSTSRLQSELVDRQGLAYELWADADLAEDHGCFDLGATVSPHKVGRVVAALLNEVATLKRQAPSAQELRRAVDRLAWGIETLRDAAPSAAEWYGRAALLDLPLQPAALLRQARAVNAAACREAARAWLSPWRMVVAGVGDVPPAQKKAVARAVEDSQRTTVARLRPR